MKVAFDLHDFSILNNRIDLLLKIKEHYPDFRVSLFTIPFDVAYEVGTQRIYHETALEKIKENLDWMQFIPHGLTHMTDEFKTCDYSLFKNKVMPSIKEAFDTEGLPFVKGFCAPYWLWNKDVVRALDKEGWWGAIDKNQDMLSTKRFYKFSHSLEEPFYKSNAEIIKLHGHIDQTSDNDLEKCFLKLFKLPQNTEWHFVTDFLEEK